MRKVGGRNPYAFVGSPKYFPELITWSVRMGNGSVSFTRLMVNRDRYLVLNSVNKSNNLPNVIYTLKISPLNIGKYIAPTLNN